MNDIEMILLSAQTFGLTFSILQLTTPNRTKNNEDRASVYLFFGYLCAIIGFIIAAIKNEAMNPFLLIISIATLVYAFIYTIVKRNKARKEVQK